MPVVRTRRDSAELLQIIESKDEKTESGASQGGTKSDMAR
jgi:hypothetical protein